MEGQPAAALWAVMGAAAGGVPAMVGGGGAHRAQGMVRQSWKAPGPGRPPQRQCSGGQAPGWRVARVTPAPPPQPLLRQAMALLMAMRRGTSKVTGWLGWTASIAVGG